MRKCLITVDYQVDFVNGSLGFDGAEKLENVIAEKIEKYRAEGADIIFTLDTHHCDYLTTFEGRILPIEHCIEYTKGHELYGKIKSMVQPNDKVFKKCTYGSEALFDYLRKCDYEESSSADLYRIFVLFQTPCLPEPLCRTHDLLLTAMPLPQMITV